MVQRQSQSEHDSLLSQLVDHLRRNGFEAIKADLSGYSQPGKIWWTSDPQNTYIPDAIATANGAQFIFEVETHDTITISHTTEQWRLFAAHAKSNNGKFVAVVPTRCKAEAEAQLTKLGITGEVWTG